MSYVHGLILASKPLTVGRVYELQDLAQRKDSVAQCPKTNGFYNLVRKVVNEDNRRGVVYSCSECREIIEIGEFSFWI